MYLCKYILNTVYIQSIYLDVFLCVTSGIIIGYKNVHFTYSFSRLFIFFYQTLLSFFFLCKDVQYVIFITFIKKVLTSKEGTGRISSKKTTETKLITLLCAWSVDRIIRYMYQYFCKKGKKMICVFFGCQNIFGKIIKFYCSIENVLLKNFYWAKNIHNDRKCRKIVSQTDICNWSAFLTIQNNSLL